MMPEARVAPPVDSAEAARLASDLYDLTATAHLLPGEYDDNFHLISADGRAFVLKIMHPAREESFVDMQCRALTHLAQRAPQLALPHVCPTSHGTLFTQQKIADRTSRLIWLLTFLPGDTLVNAKPHSTNLLESFGRLLGELDSALLDFSHPAATRDLKWDISRSLWARDFLQYIREPQRRHLAAQFLDLFEREVLPRFPQLRRSVIYGDANDYNALVTPPWPQPRRVVSVIDFGDMHHGITVAEPAIAAAYAILGENDPLPAATSVLSAYHRVFPLNEDELAAFFPLLAARLAVSVINSAHRQSLHPDDPYVTVTEAPAWAALERLANIHPRFAHYTFRAACGLPAVPHSPAIREWLAKNSPTAAVLPPHDLRKGKCLVFDLSVGSTLLGANPAEAAEPVATPKIRAALHDANVSVGIGCYNEPRPFYSSALFSGSSNPTDERRTIHLGIDLFTDPGTPIAAPFDATVHAVSNNTAPLDYGPVVILKHHIRGIDSSNVVDSSAQSVISTRHSGRSPRSEELRAIATGSRDESLFLSGKPHPTSNHPPSHFFTLYGHLSTDTLATLKPGQHIPAGQAFATIGHPHENGGWSPHLHFQIILDLLDLGTDFPGVAFASQRAAWASLSPDPNLILGIPEKLFPHAAPDLPQTLAARQSLLGKNLSVSYSQPLKIVRGWRQFLYDDTGRAYLDVYNNVPLVGHSHSRVVHAAAAQLALLNTNTRYLHDNVLRYAERLTQLLPAPLRVCYFVNSGSEANELALRLARAHTHREDVIVLEHAYHGHTSTLIDISPYKFNGPGGTGRKPWVHVAELPDDYHGRFRRGESNLAKKYAASVAIILENCKKDGRAVAAYIAETLPSVGGQIVFPPGYLAEAYQHVRGAGAVCIADEVQVGFGRLGTDFWGFETQQVVPDIVVLGKPIGNAFPLAAVITTPEIAASFANGMEFFSTFGGNPVACAAGLAVLDVLAEERLQQNALNVGTHWIAALRELQHTRAIIGDVRGSGLFLGIDLVNDPASRGPATKQATYIVNRLRERGILAGTDGPHHNVIKLRPPLIFSDDDAALFTTTLTSILEEDPSLPDHP
jgi:4-aminobutyrate aminotransferase-like enzyme/Ser/Thr protein kinase RdoA (MazF antagonist)/murein DD-endopeptidase MepM/ murein hydrolase activator NlpD